MMRIVIESAGRKSSLRESGNAYNSRKTLMAGVCDCTALYEREGKRKRKLSEICTSDLDFVARKTSKNSKLNVLRESRFHDRCRRNSIIYAYHHFID